MWNFFAVSQVYSKCGYLFIFHRSEVNNNKIVVNWHPDVTWSKMLEKKYIFIGTVTMQYDKKLDKIQFI